MSVTTNHRRALVIASLVIYALLFFAHAFVDRPTLDLLPLFFFAVALLALASGPLVGAAGGLLAAVLGVTGSFMNARFGQGEVYTAEVLAESVTMLATGAAVGWVAAANRGMVRHLGAIAERDFLTGLANMRGYEAAVQRRLASGTPFALLIADMDGLKRVNDLHGHREGDIVICRLADELRKNVRDGDEIARVGGDEFVVLTSTASSGAAWGIAARIENALAEAGAMVTFGWAVFPSEGEDEATLYRTADRRLYARKFARNKGRDREQASAADAAPVPSRLLVPLDRG